MLLDKRALKTIALPVEMLGSVVTVTAHGVGDAESAPSISRSANGEAMRPLSPAHLKAMISADGTLALNWVQRSRLAWSWVDEVESPPDPSVHGYRLKIAGVSATIEQDCSEPQATFTASQVSSLGSGPIEIQVRQIGTMALSRPQSLTINP